MVVDEDVAEDKRERRFLAYDMVMLNGQPLVDRPWMVRHACLRRTGCMHRPPALPPAVPAGPLAAQPALPPVLTTALPEAMPSRPHTHRSGSSSLRST